MNIIEIFTGTHREKAAQQKLEELLAYQKQVQQSGHEISDTNKKIIVTSQAIVGGMRRRQVVATVSTTVGSLALAAAGIGLVVPDARQFFSRPKEADCPPPLNPGAARTLVDKALENIPFNPDEKRLWENPEFRPYSQETILRKLLPVDQAVAETRRRVQVVVEEYMPNSAIEKIVATSRFMRERQHETRDVGIDPRTDSYIQGREDTTMWFQDLLQGDRIHWSLQPAVFSVLTSGPIDIASEIVHMSEHIRDLEERAQKQLPANANGATRLKFYEAQKRAYWDQMEARTYGTQNEIVLNYLGLTRVDRTPILLSEYLRFGQDYTNPCWINYIRQTYLSRARR